MNKEVKNNDGAEWWRGFCAHDPKGENKPVVGMIDGYFVLASADQKTGAIFEDAPVEFKSASDITKSKGTNEEWLLFPSWDV